MMNELVEMHKNCIDQVYQNEYYLDTFQYVCEKSGVSWAHPETNELDDTILRSLSDPEKISALWNQFWYMLPDSRSIHRPPFNLICDICEFDYREEE